MAMTTWAPSVGYKVESEPQYDYIRAQKTDPKMDFIVWRQNSYLEVHAN